jgi:hypothetical protein
VDAVYFFRPITPGAGKIATEELRYSLRSLVANMRGLDEVHVFGGRPSWLTEHVHHYPVSQGLHKHENTWKIWRQIASAARSGYLPEWFVIMNDDYFVMRPVDEVPAMHGGPLVEWAAARRQSKGIYDATMRTVALIESLGVPRAEQLTYELHVPFLTHGPTLAALWPDLDRAARGGRMPARLIKRSLIGNLTPGMNASAEHLASDVKVFGSNDPVHSGAYLSTSDLAFASRNTSRAGVEIRAAFPRSCRFEGTPSGVPRMVRASA